jgi:hypothetical protein
MPAREKFNGLDKNALRNLVEHGRQVYLQAMTPSDEQTQAEGKRLINGVYGRVTSANPYSYLDPNQEQTEKRWAVQRALVEAMRGNVSVDEATEQIHAVCTELPEPENVFCWKCMYMHVAPVCQEE